MAFPPTPAKQSIRMALFSGAASATCSATSLKMVNVDESKDLRSNLPRHRLRSHPKPSILSHPYAFIIFREYTVTLVVVSNAISDI